MTASAHLVAELAIVLGVAGVTSLIARAARQPAVLGFLLAGMVVGPYTAIPIFASPDRVNELAELGVVLVMFAVGLELRIKKLLAVLPTSGLTTLAQVSFLWWAGFSVGKALGWTLVEALFMGASISISSTMVVSKVLAERPVREDARQHIFGVLVVQDVVAIALIAAMTGLAAGGGLGAVELAAMLGRLGGVLLCMIAGGLVVVPRAMRWVLRLGSAEITTVFSVGLCFAFSFLAQALGYSVALGAFVAGMLVAESGRGEDVEHSIAPLRDVFAAIFFVSIGMTVNPLQAWQHLPISLLVTAVVILGQFISVTLVGLISGVGLHRSVIAGLTLGQIGELSFILGGIGITAGVVRGDLQPILVTVAVLTAFTTPMAIRAGERLVGLLDRALPPRLEHLLSMHEAWFARVRAGDAQPQKGARRALRAIVLDGAGLLGVLVLVIVSAGRAVDWLVRHASLSTRAALTVLLAAALAASLPLAIGLVGNTRALARHASEGMAPRLGRASRIMVYLLVVVTVGLPAIALLRPLAAGGFGLPVLGLAVAAIIVYMWQSAGALDDEFRSGAEKVAAALSRAAAKGEPELDARDTLVPGLDTVGMRVMPSTEPVGKTLAELNLRARTGATVVAIHRGGAGLVLPTGHERLQSGDLLAMAGTSDSLDRARKLIHAAPPEDATDR